jgi:hypothetical protein
MEPTVPVMVAGGAILADGRYFEKQSCFSGAVFGALAATNAEEGSVGIRLQPLWTTRAPGSFYLGVGRFKLGSCWHASSIPLTIFRGSVATLEMGEDFKASDAAKTSARRASASLQ